MTNVVRPRIEFIERLLDPALELRIERRRRFVENEDRGILENRPRDRNPLPLSARNQRSAIADEEVEPAGRIVAEFGDVRRRRRCVDRGLRRPGTLKAILSRIVSLKSRTS